MTYFHIITDLKQKIKTYTGTAKKAYTQVEKERTLNKLFALYVMNEIDFETLIDLENEVKKA